MAPFARYVISTMRAQDSAVPHQKSIPQIKIIAGNCRFCDYHWRSNWISSSAANCLNHMGMLNITISISCGFRKKYPCFVLCHCDDVGCEELATSTSTITHRTLRGATNKFYILEDRSRHSFFLLRCIHLIIKPTQMSNQSWTSLSKYEIRF